MMYVFINMTDISTYKGANCYKIEVVKLQIAATLLSSKLRLAFVSFLIFT